MRIRHLAPLLTLALPQLALGGGYAIDPELLVPSFGAGDLPGLDGAVVPGRGSGRVGALYQFSAGPVAIYVDGERLGEPVSRRATVFSAVSADLGPALTVRAVLPAVSQTGHADTGMNADGVGVGDVRLGARWLLPLDGALRLGVSGDVFLPTGTGNAWLGEDAPRLAAGPVSRLSLGTATVLADGALLYRSKVDTGLDLVMSSELRGNLGLRVGNDQVSGYAVLLTKLGLSQGSSLEGRASVEGLAGLQAQLWGPLRLDLGLGRGLSEGLGTTRWRGLAGLRLERSSANEAPQRHAVADPFARVEELAEERPAARVVAQDAERAPPPEPVWEEGELARVRVETATIEIREPIQFEFGTDRVLPVSIPTLHAVAAILEANPEIEALVIEGHASEEGSFQYNYDLAYRRSGAIFRELVQAGVHPYRLSTRSMGEVVPRGAETDEESLALNRRVEFHITRQRHPLEPSEPLDANIHQPWDGAPRGSDAPAEEPAP